MGPKMPVSMVCESQADVSSAIRNSLSATLNTVSHNGLNSSASDTSLQNQFVASAKRALMSNIEYEEVSNFNNSVHDTLKSKYIVLKPPPPSTTATVISPNSSNNGKSMINGIASDKSNNNTVSERKGAELPTPRVVLYPREKVQIGWKSSERKWQVGAGMVNVGNTCYLNSTLQALFHVPALANWLVSDAQHREMCENKTGILGGCIICGMAKTLIASQQNSQAIKPHLVYSKLRLVCKHLVPGQQEDAHEFLRYLMEAMEKAYLSRFPKSAQFDQFSKETTPINQILGGYLKTSVRCLDCHHVSVTFQHFEDLLLDIRKANTLEEALDLYFARERLEDMGYKCESCKKKVSATKQFSLERAPISLCIQLKRFSIVGNKLNKHIAIRQQLNLTKYSSRKNSNKQLIYRLVSMVTHLGASQHCGHYTAIGLTEAGGYYQFDDSCVRPISVQNVLNTNAYIMFYELETQSGKENPQSLSCSENSKLNGSNDRLRPIFQLKDSPRNNVATTVTSGLTSKAFIGPLLPSNKLNCNPSESNGVASTTSTSTVASTSNTTSTTSSHSNDRVIANSHNKLNAENKTIGAFKKYDSPIVAKLSSNSCPTLFESNTQSSSAHTTQRNVNGAMKNDSFDDLLNGSTDSNTGNAKKEPTLPSMPKLDMASEYLACNEKTVTNNHDALKSKQHAAASSNANTASPSTLSTSNRSGAHSNHSDSDLSSDEGVHVSNASNGPKPKLSKYAPLVRSKSPVVPPTPSKAIVNGNSGRLVPYNMTDDDSENDSGNDSPQEVTTKAGPFQVTNTTVTPRVVSTFLRLSVDRSPVKALSPSPLNRSSSAATVNSVEANKLTTTSNAKRDTNIIPIKTVASIAHNMNVNKRPNEWHGSETSNKLMKLTHRGYGAPVITWKGQKSSLEKEVIDERKEELTRQALSSADAEMDRGHKKKANTKLSLGRDNPGYNPFQEHQNQRNDWIISSSNRLGTSSISGNGARPFKSHFYRQKPNRPRFHKSRLKNNRSYRDFKSFPRTHMNK